MNYKTMRNYIILMRYYIKLLKVSKTEIRVYIREFERITADYMKEVNPKVVVIVFHSD